MKNNNEHGVINIDYITAMVVFVIATIAIMGLYISIYKEMAKVKVDETAIGYITEICENIDLAMYDDVDTIAEVNKIIESINLPSQYSIQCESIEKYSDSQNSEKLDVVQKLNLRIRYTFDNLPRDYMISKVKVKE